MADRQQIESGDSSFNIQAHGDVSVGLTYAEIRQAVEDLFALNQNHLLTAAGEEARRCAKDLNEAFLSRLAEAPEQLWPNFSQPSFQRALAQAQIEYATDADLSTADLYAALLVEKLQNPGRDVTAVACQLAIETVRQLNQRHLDLLSALFVLITYTPGFTSFEAMQSHFANLVAPYAYAVSPDHSLLRYLDSTLCLALDTTRAYDVQAVITRQASEIPECERGVSDLLSLAAADNQELLAALQAFDKNERFLRSCFLTTRGLAIAHANLVRRGAVLPPLRYWVERHYE
jgi:hypothetical protein